MLGFWMCGLWDNATEADRRELWKDNVATNLEKGVCGNM